MTIESPSTDARSAVARVVQRIKQHVDWLFLLSAVVAFTSGLQACFAHRANEITAKALLNDQRAWLDASAFIITARPKPKPGESPSTWTQREPQIGDQYGMVLYFVPGNL